MMKSQVKWLLVGAVLGFVSSAAVAFQETKGGGQDGQPAPKTQLDTTGTGTSIDSGQVPSGVEVRIPGLGKLGVLPKFDFGLELLYGVNEQDGADISSRLRTPDAQPEDTRIRGTLKHKF